MFPLNSSLPADSGVSCTELTYKCKNNKCISKVNPECDGTPDCEDGSDEENCGKLRGLVQDYKLVIISTCNVVLHITSTNIRALQGARQAVTGPP